MNDLSASSFQHIVAEKTWSLLRFERAVLTPSGTVFRIRRVSDRLILSFDAAQVDQDRIDDKFAHKLSTLLRGRKVVRTNSRGLFLQVGLEIPPVVELASRSLDLSEQPTPWSLPIGPTDPPMKDGRDLWLDLVKDDSFLVGGSRNMGKSRLVHSWVQALLHGGQAEIYACDGKHNVEYARYYGQPNFHLIPFLHLQDGLDEIRGKLPDRMRTLTKSGFTSVKDYNDAHPDQIIMPIALVIDEASEVGEDDQAKLANLVKVYRAAGVHPILATNDPVKAGVICKSNLTTRIALKTVSHNDSFTILVRTGAEKLPEIPGRGLLVHDGRLVQFQAYSVTVPQNSPEALAWIDTQVEEMIQMIETDQARSGQETQAQEQETAQILQMIAAGDSDPTIVRLLWNVTGGSRYYTLRNRVQALRTSSSSSSEKTSPSAPISAPKGPSLPEEEVTPLEEGEV